MDFLSRQRIKDEVVTLDVDVLMLEAWAWFEFNRSDPEHSAGALLEQRSNLIRIEQTLRELEEGNAPTDDPRYAAVKERLAGFCTHCRVRHRGLTPERAAR